MEQLFYHLSTAWVAASVRLIVVLDLLDGAKTTGVLWSRVPNKSRVGSTCQEKEMITSMPKTFPGKTL